MSTDDIIITSFYYENSTEPALRLVRDSINCECLSGPNIERIEVVLPDELKAKGYTKVFVFTNPSPSIVKDKKIPAIYEKEINGEKKTYIRNDKKLTIAFGPGCPMLISTVPADQPDVIEEMSF